MKSPPTPLAKSPPTPLVKSPPTPLASLPSVIPLTCLLATLLAVCSAAPAALAQPLGPISPITSFLDIPRTSFSCDKQPVPGIYADTDTGCQVFHFCQEGGRNDSFLCPNLTLFNQQYFVCDWSYNVDCSSAPAYFSLNRALYTNNRALYSNPERISQALIPAIKIAGQQEELLVGSASSAEVSRTSNSFAAQEDTRTQDTRTQDQDTRTLNNKATQLDNVIPSAALDTERKGRLLVLPASVSSGEKEKLKYIKPKQEAFKLNSEDIAGAESQPSEVVGLTSGDDVDKSNSEEDNLGKVTPLVLAKDRSGPKDSRPDKQTQPRSGKVFVSPTDTTTPAYTYVDTTTTPAYTYVDTTTTPAYTYVDAYSDPEPTPLDYDDVVADPEPSAGSWDAGDPEPVAIPDLTASRGYTQPSLRDSQLSYSELSSGYSQPGSSYSQPSDTYSGSSYSQPGLSSDYSQFSKDASADPEPASYYGSYDSADPEPTSFYGADTVDLSSTYDDDTVSDPEPDPSTGFYYSESPSQDLADPEPVSDPEFVPYSRR